ncbi:hypothetical protein IFM89_032868, partial [Coptis chinensis]
MTDNFGFRVRYSSFIEAIDAAKSKSLMIKQLWDIVVSTTMVTLWHHRNKIYHKDKKLQSVFWEDKENDKVGNPGPVGIGYTFRDDLDDFLL